MSNFSKIYTTAGSPRGSGGYPFLYGTSVPGNQCSLASGTTHLFRGAASNGREGAADPPKFSLSSGEYVVFV
ncbi:hypothetical protein Hanom_Chr04g00384291 [Helianthus anomalus]